MDFGLFDTWNAVYDGGKMPWDPEYSGGKLLEEQAYARNFGQVDAVENMGWDYIWLGGGHFSKQASMDPQVLMLAAVVAARGNTGRQAECHGRHDEPKSRLHCPVPRFSPGVARVESSAALVQRNAELNTG